MAITWKEDEWGWSCVIAGWLPVAISRVEGGYRVSVAGMRAVPLETVDEGSGIEEIKAEALDVVDYDYIDKANSELIDA